MPRRYSLHVHAEYHATIHDEEGHIVDEVGLGSRSPQEARTAGRKEIQRREQQDRTRAAQEQRPDA